MKRLRIYARVASFYNPCIYAVDTHESNPLIHLLERVCEVVKPLSFTLKDK